jgi:hypothetical protein
VRHFCCESATKTGRLQDGMRKETGLNQDVEPRGEARKAWGSALEIALAKRASRGESAGWLWHANGCAFGQPILIGCPKERGEASMATATVVSFSSRVMEGFAAFGLTEGQSVTYRILLQKNRIYGHRYEWAGIHAVVLVGGQSIDFYDQDCQMLRQVPLDGESEVRKAA